MILPVFKVCDSVIAPCGHVATPRHPLSLSLTLCLPLSLVSLLLRELVFRSESSVCIVQALTRTHYNSNVSKCNTADLRTHNLAVLMYSGEEENKLLFYDLFIKSLIEKPILLSFACFSPTLVAIMEYLLFTILIYIIWKETKFILLWNVYFMWNLIIVQMNIIDSVNYSIKIFFVYIGCRR